MGIMTQKYNLGSLTQNPYRMTFGACVLHPNIILEEEVKVDAEHSGNFAELLILSFEVTSWSSLVAIFALIIMSLR